MRRAATFLLTALAGCAMTMSAGSRVVDDARARDAEVVASRAEDFDAPNLAKQYVVVQDGDVAATAAYADDALRAAAAKSPSTPHRFVFRPADRGTPLYRMAYLAEGGVVVGRRFLTALGLEAAGAPGKPSLFFKEGSLRGGQFQTVTRLTIDVATLDDAAHRTIDAVYDPDFDGGLLLPVAVAAELSLERFEIPGDAEVQVALGRPFLARRATVFVNLPALSAAGAVEVVYEKTSSKK